MEAREVGNRSVTYGVAWPAPRKDPPVPPQILDFYARPSPMTSAGKHAGALEKLPNEVHALARVVQGLVVHEFVASDFYGFRIPEARKDESHIRPAEKLLDRILALDAHPLSVARPVEKRLAGVCRHFVTLLLAMLRAKGIPARLRSGFGSYFNPGYFEDHVVCEYWNVREGRWALADPQFDEVWRERARIEHDVLDVPHDRFLIAAEAWTLCRTGKADSQKFGIARGDLRGLWFAAANVVHEVAALNKMEMLRWDVWGAMPRPKQALQTDELVFFDQLSVLTRNADASFDELRRLYESDERLRVPPTVFNALLNRPEAI